MCKAGNEDWKTLLATSDYCKKMTNLCFDISLLVFTPQGKDNITWLPSPARSDQAPCNANSNNCTYSLGNGLIFDALAFLVSLWSSSGSWTWHPSTSTRIARSVIYPNNIIRVYKFQRKLHTSIEISPSSKQTIKKGAKASLMAELLCTLDQLWERGLGFRV